jgi:type IV secretory pathway TraG/TraD family ATPase VirD4
VRLEQMSTSDDVVVRRGVARRQQKEDRERTGVVSTAQRATLYRDRWETLIANTDVKQCFGTNDWTTADLLSEMAGETTVFTEGGLVRSGAELRTEPWEFDQLR